VGPTLAGGSICGPSHDEVLNASKMLKDAPAIVRPYVHAERKRRS
jgi:hypothetical protein